MQLFCVILLFLFIQLIIGADDYCKLENDYCADREHIACSTNNFTKVHCNKFNVISMDDQLKDIILEIHNVFRDTLAKGDFVNFPSASKMREIVWDDNLANLANITVNYCNKELNNKCQATNKYTHAGQNVGNIFYTTEHNPFNNSDKVIESIFNKWTKEALLNITEELHKFSCDNNITKNFEIITQDKTNAIGCAYITYDEINDGVTEHNHMITCNYAYGTVCDEVIFTSGKPCSECSLFNETCSEKYTSMCDTQNITLSLENEEHLDLDNIIEPGITVNDSNVIESTLSHLNNSDQAENVKNSNVTAEAEIVPSLTDSKMNVNKSSSTEEDISGLKFFEPEENIQDSNTPKIEVIVSSPILNQTSELANNVNKSSSTEEEISGLKLVERDENSKDSNLTKETTSDQNQIHPHQNISEGNSSEYEESDDALFEKNETDESNSTKTSQKPSLNQIVAQIDKKNGQQTAEREFNEHHYVGIFQSNSNISSIVDSTNDSNTYSDSEYVSEYYSDDTIAFMKYDDFSLASSNKIQYYYFIQKYVIFSVGLFLINFYRSN